MNTARDQLIQRQLCFVHADDERGIFLHKQDGLTLHETVRHEAITARGMVALHARDLRALPGR